MTRNEFKQWLITHVEMMDGPGPVVHLIVCEEDVWISRWMHDLGIDNNVRTPGLKIARVITFLREDFLKKAHAAS